MKRNPPTLSGSLGVWYSFVTSLPLRLSSPWAFGGTLLKEREALGGGPRKCGTSFWRPGAPSDHLYTMLSPLCARKGAQSEATGGPKCPKGGKKESKSSLLKAENVTFGCHIGEGGPLQKHQHGLRFHHIMRVGAPPFSLPKSPWERTVHRNYSFSYF